MKRITIAIVDDHALMRRGLRETLEECRDLRIIGEGNNAEDAMEIVRTLSPDIILLDINMPGSGVSVVEFIHKSKSPVKALMLTVSDNIANVRSTMSNGAHGYVLKGVSGEELVSVVRAVHGGQKFVSPELAAKLFSENPGNGQGKQSTQRPDDIRLSTLTTRERQIFSLIGMGANNLEIAQKLKLSEFTVKHYITPLFRKLGVRNRTEAALKARRIES